MKKRQNMMRTVFLIYSAGVLLVLSSFAYRVLTHARFVSASIVPVLSRGQLNAVDKGLQTRSAPQVASPSAAEAFGRTEPFSK